MLIVDFVNEREIIKKKKRHFLRVDNSRISHEIKRYSINVNGKSATVLELAENDLMREDVSTLLKAYRGKVLVSESFRENQLLKEYLYIPEAYYHRALLSSLINQINFRKKEWQSIEIKVENFIPFKELFELVKVAKTVSIITENNLVTENFKRKCYLEYGAIVSIKRDRTPNQSDIYLDFGMVDNKGRLLINAKGRELLLYPDARFFERFSEYEKLAPYNIEYNLICSAFSDK